MLFFRGPRAPILAVICRTGANLWFATAWVGADLSASAVGKSSIDAVFKATRALGRDAVVAADVGENVHIVEGQSTWAARSPERTCS
jgi:hypothetical protein